MPRHGGDESMDLSDDDSISITSTVASETLEEYVVEGIIAERMHGSEMQYLVKWVGYPDERCTWEPESSFQSEDTLLDWQAQKMRYSRGLETPCNVNALLDKVEEWITSTAERKSRRRAKRLRLGLSVSPLESDVEDECDDYDNSEPVVQPSNSGGRAPTAIMVELHKLDQSVGKFNTASQTLTASSTNNAFDYIGGGQRTAKSAMPTSGRESDGKSIRDVDRKEVLPKLVSKLRVSIPSSSIIANPRVSRRTSETGQDAAQLDLSPQLMHSTISNKSGSPNDRRASLSEQRPPSTSAGLDTSTGRNNSKSEKELTLVKKTQMGRSGRGPARLSASKLSSSSASLKKNDVSGAAILGNWNRVVKRRKAQALQPDLSRAGGKPVEMFGKLSTLRRFEKAGRNEPAPDINSLTFVDLKHGRVTKRPTLVSPKLTIPSKTPFELIQEGLEETPRDKMDAEPYATNNATVGVQDPTLDVAASNAPEAETTGTKNFQSQIPLLTEIVTTSPLDEQGGKSRDPRVQSRRSFQSYKEKSVPSSLVSASERHTTSPRNPLAEGSIMNTSRQQPTQNSMTTVPMEIDSQQAQDNNALVASVLQPSRTPRQVPWVDVASDLRHLAAPTPLSKTQHDFISSKEAGDVLGTLLIGPECRNLGDVRFRGLETPAKHLFLSIKVPPRQMHVWCQHICSAGEYQAYYHLVSCFITSRALIKFASRLTKARDPLITLDQATLV